MILLFGITPLDEYKDYSYLYVLPTAPKWAIEIYNRNMIFKKRFVVGAKDCIIESLKYSENEKGCLNATMKINDYDFLIEYGDFVIVWKNGIKDYSGYIVAWPENEGGSITINSLLNRLNELVYTGSFYDANKIDIVEDILITLFPNSKINFNANLIELDSSETFSPTYNSTKGKTTLDDWVKSEDASNGGANPDNFYFVKKRKTTISQNIYPGMYEKMKYTLDYSKIKFSRIDLYLKEADSSGNEVEVFVSQIPDGIDYNYFDIEETIGVKIEKKVAPKNLTETEAKEWAYGECLSQIKPVEQITVTGLNINVDVKVFDKIRIYDSPKMNFEEVIDTETLENWSGDRALSSDSYDGDYSVLINGQGIYTFEIPKVYSDIKKLVFYIKGTYGYKGSISIETLSGEEIKIKDININIDSDWNYIDINIFQKVFKKIIFNLNNVKVDFGHILGIYRKYYEMNVIEREIDLSEGKLEKYNIKLGAYDDSLNDLQFKWAKEIERRSA